MAKKHKRLVINLEPITHWEQWEQEGEKQIAFLIANPEGAIIHYNGDYKTMMKRISESYEMDALSPIEQAREWARTQEGIIDINKKIEASIVDFSEVEYEHKKVN